MSQLKPPSTTLPHHKLFAYELCLSLVKLVPFGYREARSPRSASQTDAQLRAQARKSAASYGPTSHPSPRQAGCGRDAPSIPRCKRRNMSATWKNEIAAVRENSRDFSGGAGN